MGGVLVQRLPVKHHLKIISARQAGQPPRSHKREAGKVRCVPGDMRASGEGYDYLSLEAALGFFENRDNTGKMQFMFEIIEMTHSGPLSAALNEA